MTRHEPDDDAVSQYVAGTMPADDLDEFEQHLLTCETCRTSVQVGAAARVVLVRQTSAARVPVRRAPGYWMGAVAAAVVIALVATRSPKDPLGEVTPAPFVADALRPSLNATTSLVDSGMGAYIANDFGAAAERLGRAARTDSSASVAFFLGVSLLLNGDAASALDALGRGAAGPYAGEAAYYMAKALVRLKRPDAAIAVLDQATAPAPMQDILRAFADSIRRR